MAEDSRDPFDFEEDPLAGVEDLDLPPSFDPPTSTPPQTSFDPPTSTPPPVGSPPGGFGGPPTAPPPSGAPPTEFPAPAATPPADVAPPAAPPSYDNFGAPPMGASGVEPPEQPIGMPPSYSGTPPPGQYGSSMPPPAYGTGIPPQDPAQKKTRGCLFWGVIVLVVGLLLIGGCTAFVVFSGQSASDAANDFLAEVQDQDFDGAAGLANSACNLSAVEIEQDLGGLSEYFIIGAGPIATGSVTVDGQEFTIAFELRDDQICSYALETVGS